MFKVVRAALLVAVKSPELELEVTGLKVNEVSPELSVIVRAPEKVVELGPAYVNEPPLFVRLKLPAMEVKGATKVLRTAFCTDTDVAAVTPALLVICRVERAVLLTTVNALTEVTPFKVTLVRAEFPLAVSPEEVPVRENWVKPALLSSVTRPVVCMFKSIMRPAALLFSMVTPALLLLLLLPEAPMLTEVKVVDWMMMPLEEVRAGMEREVEPARLVTVREF